MTAGGLFEGWQVLVDRDGGDGGGGDGAGSCCNGSRIPDGPVGTNTSHRRRNEDQSLSGLVEEGDRCATMGEVKARGGRGGERNADVDGGGPEAAVGKTQAEEDDVLSCDGE